MQNLTELSSRFLDYWAYLKHFIQYGSIPAVAFSSVPLIAAMAAIFMGVRLLRKLEPGMVCRASLGCDRCELLYSVGLGSTAFPLIYIIMELKWLASENYTKISSFDEVLWCSWEAAVMFFMAWASYRSIHCLGAHCSFDPFPVCRGRNHRNR